MAVSIIYGLPGKGKSLFSLFYALELANKYKKKLACNFLLNPYPLLHYCRVMGYDYLYRSIMLGNGIFYLDLNSNLENLLSIPNCVVVLDEAAIYFPSRSMSSTQANRSLVASLVQVRHKHQHLIAIAQHERQLESQLKSLAEEIIHCNGTTILSSDGSPKLIMQIAHRFLPDNYEKFMNDPKIRTNPLKVRICAAKSWVSTLNCKHSLLFRCYNSFNDVHAIQKLSDGFLAYRFPQEESEIQSFSVLKKKNQKVEDKITIHPSISAKRKLSMRYLAKKSPMPIAFARFPAPLVRSFYNLPANLVRLVLKIDWALSK